MGLHYVITCKCKVLLIETCEPPSPLEILRKNPDKEGREAERRQWEVKINRKGGTDGRNDAY
jgi:hypothetical protein